MLLLRSYLVDENVSVDAPGRRVSVRVVPYGVPAVVRDSVDDPGRGLSKRPYREAWAEGVFRHAVRAPHRVPFLAGRDHSVRVSDVWSDIGRAVSLVERDTGLYAEMLVDETAFGDAALVKIASGQWRGISVGAKAQTFRDDGDVAAGGVRLRTRAALDHILLTEHGAYQGAEVLSVRSGSPLADFWRTKYSKTSPGGVTVPG